MRHKARTGQKTNSVFLHDTQATVTPTHAARGLPAVQLSMQPALQQQQAPIPSCINVPAQGASHNGVALPNLHIEAELKWVEYVDPHVPSLVRTASDCEAVASMCNALCMQLNNARQFCLQEPSSQEGLGGHHSDTVLLRQVRYCEQHALCSESLMSSNPHDCPAATLIADAHTQVCSNCHSS